MTLDRFVDAQRPVYAAALAELRSGAKHGHWMWFIFPQIAGLGQSHTARHYAIADLDEARAYLAHDDLGPRLHEASRALCRNAAGKSAAAILGAIDAIKLRSSMTLFEAAADGHDASDFTDCLDLFFGGQRDQATIERLQR